jgi:hemerythrin-like domain-containing protein
MNAGKGNLHLQFRYDIKKHLAQEHSELLRSLKSLSTIDGSMGESAGNLLKSLVPHVMEEEKTVVPLLSSIEGLVEGNADMNELSRLSLLGSSLTETYADFLREHSDIEGKAENLLEIAKNTGNTEAVSTIEGLQHHIFIEELFLYPFSILAGKYAALRMSENRRSH